MKMRMKTLYRVVPVSDMDVWLLTEGLSNDTSCVPCANDFAHMVTRDFATMGPWVKRFEVTEVGKALTTTGPCSRCASYYNLDLYLYGKHHADVAASLRGYCGARYCDDCL